MMTDDDDGNDGDDDDDDDDDEDDDDDDDDYGDDLIRDRSSKPQSLLFLPLFCNHTVAK